MPNPRRQRDASRVVHLIAAVTLAVAAFMPLSTGPRLLLGLLGIAVAGCTGLFMWKQAAFRKLFSRRTATEPVVR